MQNEYQSDKWLWLQSDLGEYKFTKANESKHLDLENLLTSCRNNQNPGQHIIHQEPQNLNSFSSIIAQIIEQEDPIQYKNSQNIKHNKFNLQQIPFTTSIFKNNLFDQIIQPIIEENRQVTKQQESQQKYEKEKIKNEKQQMYCKKYRQKKKNIQKQLEEQNCFLKKKIQDLHFRLKQKQIELNNLKYGKYKPQLSIQQLNRQLFQKIKLITQNIDSSYHKKDKENIQEHDHQNSQNILNNQNQITNRIESKHLNKGIHKLVNQNNQLSKVINQQQIFLNGDKSISQFQDMIYKQFFQYFENHGYGGKKRIQALDYYINEILQTVLHDSQKYYFITTIKDRGWAKKHSKSKQDTELNIIDIASNQIMDLDNENQQKLQCYYNFLKPLMTKFAQSCSLLFKHYNKMVQQLQRIRQFMKVSYSSNFQFAKKRIKMQNWFQFNKYRRQMRDLRKEWTQLIKSQIQQNNQQKQSEAKGSKKSKIDANSQPSF